MTPPLAFLPSGWRRCSVGLCLFALVGCSSPQGGTDVGNGRTIQLDLQGYEPTVTTRALELEGASVDSAYVAVDRVRLVPGADCSAEDDQDIDVAGPLVADLLDGMVAGRDAQFQTTATEFCELKIGLHHLELSEAPPDTPAELDGLSLRVTGRRLLGNVPFVVESDLSERFELNAKAGSFSLAATRIIVGFRMNEWIAALDLDSLPGNADILVNEQSNPDALQAFEDAVESSARLFEDQNDDGNLTEDEHDEEDELAD